MNPLIPEGMVEGWKIVRPDLTTRNGYRWPWPGKWAKCPPRTKFTTGNPCPQFDGDGLCVAKTWAGASSGGYPAVTALLLAYHPTDVLGEDADKLRVKRALVVDVYDPQALIRRGWCAGADLTGANLARADLYRADLAGANLTGANLAGANLAGANLARADLTGANLARADLYRADLTGADLARANLTRADLTRANLTRADLTRANLYGADLAGADLAGADLARADLTRADLTGADLTGADLAGADLYGWWRGPDGFACRKAVPS